MKHIYQIINGQLEQLENKLKAFLLRPFTKRKQTPLTLDQITSSALGTIDASKIVAGTLNVNAAMNNPFIGIGQITNAIIQDGAITECHIAPGAIVTSERSGLSLGEWMKAQIEFQLSDKTLKELQAEWTAQYSGLDNSGEVL